VSKIPIAVQLYSVRDECARDLPGTIAKVAAMGYDGVDFAGYYNYSAAELRKMCDDAGLKVAGTHIGMDTLLGDNLAATIEFNAELGNRFLIVPWINEPERDSAISCWKTAEVFNGIAARLAPHGMMTGYHNHHAEFTDLGDGLTAWDALFDKTGAGVVMQLDTGNGLAGGAKLEEILKRHPGKATTVHLKPYSTVQAAAAGFEAGYKPLIGADDVPWRAVFDLCEATGGTEWYIVEYESDAYPALESVDRCIKILRDWGK
jgi:sugar phosphate isomerase/epimerase